MRLRWAPAIVLLLGTFLTMGVGRQRSLPLTLPLGEAVPSEIAGFVAQDVLISDAEARAVGFSDYLFRTYGEPESRGIETQETGEEVDAPASIPYFTLYVGYYQSQAQGNTIHSPKNCLPGAGWEALSSHPQELEVDGRLETVNRYLIQNKDDRALVLYWYQGRGRIASNEYRVKLDLLMDAAIRSRSDEALVRIVVPVLGTVDAAQDLAVRAAEAVIPGLDTALPDV
jgi:EpsI family protein